MDCSPPGSSVHGILQAWIAISFSRGSSQPRIEPGSSALQADSLPLSHQGSSCYTCFIYSSNIHGTSTRRHCDKYKGYSGEQKDFTIYNILWVWLALSSPWESDHELMVFPDLWCSKLDPGIQHAVPAISEQPTGLFQSLHFLLLTAILILSLFVKGSFIYLASMNIIILMLKFIQRIKYRQKLSVSRPYLFLSLYIHIYIHNFRDHIYICIHVCIYLCPEYFFKVNCDGIQ